eukprot:TRINITY_DN15583_c0_g1_i1.p1 TRINITY_DN15583_c0_g1~~TRINITY_DN15583_c0_g1_i1.p1  ORF type:complete len:791 (+),score=55.17 TRINITY_DN15583_c0_g1_i1:275-2647(+)
MYHQVEGDGWRAASPVRVVRNLSPPRTITQSGGNTPGSANGWYARAGEIARLGGKAEMLRTQITTMREGSMRRLTPGTRVRAVSELTVRGIQAVAVGDLGVVHGPSDDPSLHEGINIRWDCRRDGGTRRINVLISDIDPVPEYVASHASPSPYSITRSPYAPSLPRPSPTPLAMFTSPVPVHTQTTPSISAAYPPIPPPDVPTPHRATTPPKPSRNEIYKEEEGRLRTVQKRCEEEEKRLAAIEAERRREEEKAKITETAIKTEETRLREITRRIQEEEEKLQALLQRKITERHQTERMEIEKREIERLENERLEALLEAERLHAIDEAERLEEKRLEAKLEAVRRAQSPSPVDNEEAILNELTIRMEDSVRIDPMLSHVAHISSPEKDSNPSISRQPSSKIGRHITFNYNSLENTVASVQTPHTHYNGTIDEVESLMIATPPTQAPPIQGKLGQIQGEWRDNGECKWVVDELTARMTRPNGTSSVYQITCTPTGGLILDGAHLVEVRDKEVTWEDGDTWTKVIPEFHPIVHRFASSVSSANTTPAVWMSMSRRNSKCLGSTQRSIISRKGSLGRILSKLADEQEVEQPPIEDDFISEDEPDVDDVVWWQVPRVNVDNVTFIHPHHGDPPGATTSPRINTVITFDTHGEPPRLRCSYDGQMQSKITSITLERTEHGVFLLFPDEGDGPVPDRVVALPPDNMNTVVAGIVCLAEKANVMQHLVYEYEALANQEAIVERFLKANGVVPWSFVNSLLPPDYLKEPASDACVLAALCVIASGIHSGRSGMCLIM